MINKSDLPKFSPDLYTKITLNELVVFSIYYLHNKNAEVTPEDIISTCFMLFPKRFSLKKHPRWPDSAMVSRHWGVCRSKGYLAAHDPGFKLTAKGSRLSEKVAKLLGRAIPKRAVKTRPPRPKAHAILPAGKVRSVRREEKTTKPAIVKKVQHPRSRAHVVPPRQKAGAGQKKKATSPVPVKRAQPPRSKVRVVRQAKEVQPVQKEKATPPAVKKKARPVRSKRIFSAKKEKVAIPPAVGKMRSTRAKARAVRQAKEVQPVQKEKATPPVPRKKVHPVRSQKVSSAKKEKKIEIAQKEKAALRPAARKTRVPRSKMRPATQIKTTQPAPRKTIPPRPVAQPIRPDTPARAGGAKITRPAKLMRDARPIWSEKIKPPEPVVRPAVVEKAGLIQPEKAIPAGQSTVTQETKVRAGKFVRAMETSDAYIHYKKNGKSSKISEFDFRSLLLCTMESPPETLARNMQQFKGYASIYNRQDLVAFLNFCEDKLSHLLTSQTTRPAKPIRKN